jgi:excinuclease ABC subunit B
MPRFEVQSAFQPTGDQPQAIEELVRGINRGDRFQTLLGATGTGKTFTMAKIVEQIQKPTLVIAHNKTLAAQLCNEFREFFPNNAVEYFVSYYDYYQPEAYVPSSDLYIEKDSSINDDIDRLRHAATSALLARKDVLVVASVSCIYGLGGPEQYRDSRVILTTGDEIDRDEMLRKLVRIQYERNDMVLERGRFRVRGDTMEVQPANMESAFRVKFFGDEVEEILPFDPLTGDVGAPLGHIVINPARHYVTDPDTIEGIVAQIRQELNEQIQYFQEKDQPLEEHRIRQRTEHDLEMMLHLGFCNGIENYSRYFDGRAPGETPSTLFNYFPDDFLLLIDESHNTIPQIGAMHAGDKSRKETLVEFGFRLPSAMDNRPLRFEEFLARAPQTVFVSATPGPFELEHSDNISEQVIRPTGLIDPEIEVRPTMRQMDDLMNEARGIVERGGRILVTTLTKKMAEDLTDYLVESNFKVRYLHSEVDTLERIRIIRDLRLGEQDILVGVNLLREGLDLPEVQLVAILDADKEGFLRGKTALVQTIGRAARNVEGRVIMYADRMTAAMEYAIGETDRRREKQRAYNEEHGITPLSIQKGVSDIAEFLSLGPTVPGKSRGKRSKDKATAAKVEVMSDEERTRLIVELEEEMFAAAESLEFERAAKLRDRIKQLHP